MFEMIENLDNSQCEWLMLRNKLGTNLRTVPTALALSAALAVDKLVDSIMFKNSSYFSLRA